MPRFAEALWCEAERAVRMYVSVRSEENRRPRSAQIQGVLKWNIICAVGWKIIENDSTGARLILYVRGFSLV